MKIHAFPTPDNGDEGMALRDWFAGQVLIGLCSNLELYQKYSNEILACDAYNLADEMLKARGNEVN
jgi:hypothetical protein